MCTTSELCRKWLQRFLTCQLLYSNRLTAFTSCKCGRYSHFWYLPVIVPFQCRQSDVQMQMANSLAFDWDPTVCRSLWCHIDMSRQCLRFHFSQSRIKRLRLFDCLVTYTNTCLSEMFMSSRWIGLAFLACNQRVKAMRKNWSTLVLHDTEIPELVLT